MLFSHTDELLWFAFKFYLWQRSYKDHNVKLVTEKVVICFQILSLTTFLQVLLLCAIPTAVVICFQILSLTTFLQAFWNELMNSYCCDLLSSFIFDNVLTRVKRQERAQERCDLLSNFIFDNVLTRVQGLLVIVHRCDLLSNFIFDNVLTSSTNRPSSKTALWFAFKFYLWQRSYKKQQRFLQKNWVVICFQILSLTTFLQATELRVKPFHRCDLLSNFIFDNVLTSVWWFNIANFELWFAFKFYLWQRSYKNSWCSVAY